MPTNQARRQRLRQLASALNTIAGRHGVTLVDRDAGLPAIKDMRRRLLLRLHADKTHIPQASEDFLLLQSTWEAWLNWDKNNPGEGPYNGQDAGARRNFRMNGLALLLTYNLPDSFQSREPSEVFAEFGAWFDVFVAAEEVYRWSRTIERSLKSADSGRVHIHAFIEFQNQVDWTTTDRVVFADVRS